MENSLAKLTMCLPYDPATAVLGNCPRQMATHAHIRMYTQMFLAAEKWKQSTDVLKQVSSQTKCGTSTLWGTTEPQKVTDY